jgi:hypothetical protein
MSEQAPTTDEKPDTSSVSQRELEEILHRAGRLPGVREMQELLERIPRVPSEPVKPALRYGSGANS